MFCLLGDNVPLEAYCAAGLHYSMVIALVYGVYRLVHDGRKQREAEE